MQGKMPQQPEILELIKYTFLGGGAGAFANSLVRNSLWRAVLDSVTGGFFATAVGALLYYSGAPLWMTWAMSGIVGAHASFFMGWGKRMFGMALFSIERAFFKQVQQDEFDRENPVD